MNDLTTAFLRALERGESLEKAKTSMLNAGYSRQEIEEAARDVQGKVSPSQEMQMPSPISYSKPLPQIPVIPEKTNKNEMEVPSPPRQVTQYQKIEQKSSIDFALIFLIIFLLLVIGCTISVILFWDKIISLIFPA
jgi:hypothetical protein